MNIFRLLLNRNCLRVIQHIDKLIFIFNKFKSQQLIMFIDCFLNDLGKPVFHAHSNTYFGSWMRDAYPRTGADSLKRWLTTHFQGNTIKEYETEADLRRQIVYRT